MLRVLTIAGLVLTVYACVDCVRTPRAEVRTLPKPVWVLAILLLPFVGPVAWLLAGKHRARPQGRPTPRPTAPDDDPEFLRRIDEQQRREQRQRRGGEPDLGDGRRDDGPPPQRT